MLFHWLCFPVSCLPLILLEKHCKLWEQGSLLTSLTSQVSTAASLELMSFLLALQLLLPLQGLVICQPFSGYLIGVQGVGLRHSLECRWEDGEGWTPLSASQLHSSALTCLLKTSSPLFSLQLADPCTAFIQLLVCLWATFIMSQMPGPSRRSHISLFKE